MPLNKLHVGFARGILIAIGCLPLFMGKYLPMVDLPQHAAQISIINHFTDPHFGFQSQFLLDWYVPYSLGYFLTSQLAQWIGLFWALKLTVVFSVAALPLSLSVLLKETGGDPWWSLIGVPLAYGFSFYWGFLSYVVAIPVGIYFVALAYRSVQNPTAKTGFILFLLALLTFFAHAIVYLMCGLVAGMAALHSRKPVKALMPLVATVPFVLFWLLFPAHQVPRVISWTDWGGHEWGRFPSLVKNLLSNTWSWKPALFSLLLVASVALGARLKPFRILFYAPFFLALLIYEITPHHAMDISFLFQRLAPFVPLFLLMCFSPAESERRRFLSRGLLSVLVLFWSLLLAVQFRSFNMEARDFDAVISKIKMNKKSLGIIYDHGGIFPFEGVFGHFPAYAQALKGGGYSFSFATSFKSVARYKPFADQLPFLSPSDLMTDNEKKMKTALKFDYFIVRAIRDRLPDMSVAVRERFEFIDNKGPWWVYQKKEVTP